MTSKLEGGGGKGEGDRKGEDAAGASAVPGDAPREAAAS
eukprot:gene5623-17576_t